MASTFFCGIYSSWDDYRGARPQWQAHGRSLASPPVMLDTIVRYLHGARVPFKLTSYPSEEPSPQVAHALPPHSVLVDTEIIRVGDRVALACFPAGEQADHAAIGAALGGVAVSGDASDLPGELGSMPPPVPPLGQLMGLTLVVDERLAESAILVFQVGGSDFFEVPYEDWARLEAPRMAAFASMGELPEKSGSPSASRQRRPAAH
jgi:prolyl-tRNA editing enzyme YbaK/EbsC (Cys-tRNA(Pro) deacylase)